MIETNNSNIPHNQNNASKTETTPFCAPMLHPRSTNRAPKQNPTKRTPQNNPTKSKNSKGDEEVKR